MGIIGVPLGYIMYAINFFINNYGLSLVLFIIVTKLALFPLAIKQQKSTARMSSMSGKTKELQRKYGNDKEKLSEATMKMYEEEGYNPMGGCLPTIVQMVLLFGIIDVIYKPMQHLLHVPKEMIQAATDLLTTLGGKPSAYAEIEIITKVQENIAGFGTIFTNGWLQKIQNFDMNFLGINMGEVPRWDSPLILIPIISGLAALAQTVISMRINKKNGQEMQGTMKYAMYFMPLMSVFIGFQMMAGVGIYWILSSVTMIAQQLIVQAIWPPEKVAQMTDKNAEKQKAKMKKKREAMEEYNKMLEAKGMAPKKIPPKLVEKKVIDKEALKAEKDATNKKIAEARKRMAERYGDSYDESAEIVENSKDAKIETSPDIKKDKKSKKDDFIKD